MVGLSGIDHTGTITLTVKLYGVFRIDRFKQQRLECAAGISVDEVVEHLRLNRRLLGTVLINGRHVDPADILTDGDTLALLPILEGG